MNFARKCYLFQNFVDFWKRLCPSIFTFQSMTMIHHELSWLKVARRKVCVKESNICIDSKAFLTPLQFISYCNIIWLKLREPWGIMHFAQPHLPYGIHYHSQLGMLTSLSSHLSRNLKPIICQSFYGVTVVTVLYTFVFTYAYFSSFIFISIFIHIIIIIIALLLLVLFYCYQSVNSACEYVYRYLCFTS